MRKIVFIISLLCLCGCNAQQMSINTENMYIQPTEFSQETQKILQIFENEMYFFDVKVDDTVKSYQVQIWTVKDGMWINGTEAYGYIENIGDLYAIKLTDTNLELYSIDEDGFSKSSYEGLETNFDNCTTVTWWQLDDKREIVVDEEIVLWTMVGTDKTFFEFSDLENNFKEIDCTNGIAITITFRDTELE